MDQPRIPHPQIVYGRVIFWLCVVAAVISVVGPVLSMAYPENNVLNPQHLFVTIWEGNNPEAVWQAGGGFPGGHFWLRHLDTGDGLTQLGLVIGCAGAFLALLASSMAFLRERRRSYGWALVALLISLMVLLSGGGIVSL